MSKRIILAVDDEPTWTRLIKINLERAGYEVHTANDGVEALNRLTTMKAEARKPDLILLDITMPYMDGFEMLHRMKEDPEIKDIPVIVLTARSRDSDILHGQEAGAVRYLPKPPHPKDLLTYVREALGDEKI
ncbi:MAG TPA: response regulator [Chthonomonadaceae bacterium]|nr:response regulator [Chthonomonadaceae bacterium]